MGITYESAEELLYRELTDLRETTVPFREFYVGIGDGRHDNPYRPTGDMWEQYDYRRGYGAGDEMFDEANEVLMEDGDE